MRKKLKEMRGIQYQGIRETHMKMVYIYKLKGERQYSNKETKEDKIKQQNTEMVTGKF